MDDEQQAGAVELDARVRGVSPPVTPRIWIGEQASLAELERLIAAAASANGRFKATISAP
jgi:hypothetical protein